MPNFFFILTYHWISPTTTSLLLVHAYFLRLSIYKIIRVMLQVNQVKYVNSHINIMFNIVTYPDDWGVAFLYVVRIWQSAECPGVAHVESRTGQRVWMHASLHL